MTGPEKGGRRVAVLVLLGELVALAVLVTGVAMVYLPAGLIVAGVLGVVALERVPTPAKKRGVK